MTTLAAERHVEIQAKRDRRRAGVQRGNGIAIDGVLRPDGERRVVRDEIAADLGFVDRRGRCGFHKRAQGSGLKARPEPGANSFQFSVQSASVEISRMKIRLPEIAGAGHVALSATV